MPNASPALTHALAKVVERSLVAQCPSFTEISASALAVLCEGAGLIATHRGGTGSKGHGLCRLRTGKGRFKAFGAQGTPNLAATKAIQRTAWRRTDSGALREGE